MTAPSTIFIDIDGTILKQLPSLYDIAINHKEQYVLPGVIEKFEHWKNCGHCIVITTSRPESLRKITEEQLSSLGIIFDQILFGLPHGERVVVNNSKNSYYGEYCSNPELEDPLIEKYYYQTARAFTVKKDAGITDVNIDEPVFSFIQKIE